MAPSGGLAAIGSSLGIGVPVKPAGRTRIATAGLNSVAALALTPASCRSAVTSSMIQKPRP